MNFLKNTLASILGVLIASGILFIIFFVFIAIAGTAEEDSISVRNNSVLDLKFNAPLKDYGGAYHFSDIEYSFEKYDGLNHVLNAIEKAKEDPKIEGISISNSFLMAGIAQTKAIRDALIDFKTSGKFVYAYSDYYAQKDYYLASVADSIFLNPSGELLFRGLAAEVLFFKDFQEKSGIKMEVVRHGKYKSAVEPFLDDKMSDANREQLYALLTSVWGSVLDDIAESRNLSVEELNTIADELLGRSPKLAKTAKLIDEVAYYDEYEIVLKNAIGLSEDEDINYVKLEDYAEYAYKKFKSGKKDKIAVIYAQGDILYGEGNNDYIGQGIIVKSLKEAREDTNVKAIVLRVNSPGGSALTSEIIWRELEITKNYKPLVVSMGNLAASGGYYIALSGQKIFAEPSTITGSIGVFGTLPNFKGLADKLGINSEQVVTNKQAIGYTPFEPLSDAFYNETKENVNEIYNTFIKRVADARNLSVASVDSIAQGRVWSGIDAKQIGLIDEIGGLDDAIAAAANFGEVAEYRIKNYPVYKTSIEEVIDRLFGIQMSKSKTTILKEELGAEGYELLRTIQAFAKQKGIQARIPYELNIK
ncbi:signal peptide peptidase SppA [Leptobacterium sp. I13]|uniref:signal peptide peptidase SppA n=1 Tax=Leptobacterium meishanense TaxID=3128904 RepID=UPI0030EF6F59